MKKISKTLALILAFVLVLGMTAFAAEAETETEEVAVETEAAETEASEVAEAETEEVKTEAVMTIDDYSTIEVLKSDVEVTEDEVQEALDNVALEYTSEEHVTEGTLELGDAVNIDFSGVLEGEEEPFEGGTAAGYTLYLGSGSMIPGFEEAIVGHEVGETFDIEVTFPEDYTETLAGKNAIFTITANYKVVTVYPEVTDEMVQTYSEANLEVKTETVEEFKQYVKDFMYNNKLETAIYRQMVDRTHIESFDSDMLKMFSMYYYDELNYQAQMYGMDADTIASIYGYDGAIPYAYTRAESFLTTYMIIEYVCNEKGIEVTDEEIDAELQAYMDESGYSAQFPTVEEFKAAVGPEFIIQYKTSIKAQKFMDALKEQTVVVDDEAVETEAAEEAETEATAETEAEAE